MIKYIAVLFGAILLLLHVRISFAIIKNPFLFPPAQSCDELNDQLIAQLNLWQYQGYIELFSTEQYRSPTVWLFNQREWLTINDLDTPVALMPWSIADISSQQIRWQANLPRYCHKQIIFNMQFIGKQ